MRATGVFVAAISAASSAVAQQPADRWEKYVAAFDKADRAAAPPTGEIVFVGSSTMRRWDVASYFPDLKIINRGIDGTELAGGMRYIDRLVLRYEPRLVVVCVNLMLGWDEEPRRELFVEDGLHLSPLGYQLWTAVLRPYLVQQ